MYAYVFGEHGTELSGALEMVGRGEEGDRIRAVAEVTFGDFGSVVAIEGPHMEALDAHVASLTSTGYTQQSAMLLCTLPPCHTLPLPSGVMPSYNMPAPAMAFVLVELTRPVEAWPELRSPQVAAGAEAGGRRVLLELCADDLETIQADLAALGEVREVRALRAAYLPASRFRTSLLAGA
jgi:hypothetical protein